MTYRVGIGVTIDASGAKTGAGEARQAVQSIGDAAQGATSKLQQLINASVGMHDAGTIAGAKAWTGALASEGMALDTLRAKYSPLFATIQQYKAAQTEIRTAHAMGALSADEQAGALAADRATAARLKARAAYSAAIDTETGREARGQSQATAIVGRQTIVPDREADVAAYGASLDGLRAKYSPLFATIQQYKAAQTEIRTAHAMGALSADEMSAALTRQRQQALSTIAAIKGLGTAQVQAQATAGARRNFGWQQLGLQGNDVATMMMMGAPAGQIAASQGPQIFQTMQMWEGGVSGAMSDIYSTIGGLITRFPLLTAAAAASSIAIASLYAVTRQEGPSAEEALTRHEELVKRIKDAYGDAAASVGKLRTEEKGILAFQAGQNAADLKSNLALELERERNALRAQFIDQGSGMVLGPAMPIEGQLRTFIGSTDDSGKALATLRKELTDIGTKTADADLKTLIDSIITATAKTEDLRAAVVAASDDLPKLSANAVRLAERLKNYNAELPTLSVMGLQPLSPQQEIERQYQLTVSQATNREQRDDAADARARALDRLREQLDLTRQSDDLGTRAILARTAAERANIAAEQARIAGLQGHQDADQIAQAERAARANVFAQDQTAAADRLRQAQRSASTVGLTGLPAQIAQINASYADEIEKATGDAAAIERLTQARAVEIETAKRAATADPLRQSSQSSADLEVQMAQQSAAFGRSAEEAARLSEAMRLYAEYARQGVEITPELAAQIDVAARRYGHAAGEMDKLAKAQQETISGLDAMRSTGRSVLDKLIGGDLKGGLTAALDGIKGRWLDMLSQSMFGQQGSTETGSLGGLLAPLFGASAGARGTAGNPMWVTWSGNALGGGLLGSAANNNALGAVTGAGRSASILDLIARAEGTDQGRGYNETLGYGRFTGNRNLTGMTLDQIDALQTAMLANPANAYNSSAVGRYQITRTTLRGLRDQLGLSGSDLYDPAMQDQLALQLLARRGGSLTGLRQEWTGLGRIDDATLQGALGGAGAGRSGPLDLGQYLNADWAKQQTEQIGGVFGELTSGLGGIVNQFLPGFGSILTTLLNGIGNAGGGSGGLFGWLGNLFGGGSSGYGSLGVGTGGLYANGGVPRAAGLHRYVNTIVDRPTTFAFARGAGLMGEAGPEAIMPLTRDAAGRLGVRAASDAPTANSGSSVVINNYSGGQVQTEERTDDQGRRQTVVTIGEMTAGAVSQRGNPLRRSLQSEFGLRPRGIVR
mgnify:CR=1 FL=1